MRTVTATLFACAVLAGPCRADGDACSPRVFEGSHFTVCEFDSHADELRVLWSDKRGVALRSFSNLSRGLGAGGSRVLFAMNAGMFGANGAPIGLFVRDGVTSHGLNTRDGSGNFYLKPNGVFSLNADGTLHIDTTEAFAARNGSPRWATQSGPMLLVDGKMNPQISPDGPSQNIRNGVGALGPTTAAFVISDEPVSFGRIARFFRDELGCRDALYFDGAVSSLWDPARARRDDHAPLGPMVVVLRKE